MSEHEDRRGENWHVLVLGGELDLDSAPELRRSLLTAINEGHHRVVVDLMSATFVDSSGLGVLVNALRRLQAVGGELRVAAGNRAITSVIRISGLDRLLGLYPDVESAVTADAPESDALRASGGLSSG